jgi:hypothetical protein
VVALCADEHIRSVKRYFIKFYTQVQETCNVL